MPDLQFEWMNSKNRNANSSLIIQIAKSQVNIGLLVLFQKYDTETDTNKEIQPIFKNMNQGYIDTKDLQEKSKKLN